MTQKELSGICERFNKKQSQRQRIVITRSEDPHGKHLAPTALTHTDAGSLLNSGDETARKQMGSLNTDTGLHMYNNRSMNLKEPSHASVDHENYAQGHNNSQQISPMKKGRPFQSGKAVNANNLHFKSVNSIDDQGVPAILESNEMFATMANHTHQAELPSNFKSPIHAAHLNSSRFMVDVQTPQGSNATMERIRKVAADKKVA